MNILTREEFIELSGIVHTANNLNQTTITFNNQEISITTAESILEDYRNNNKITITGKIPDKFTV
jgi:hypothetical protein